MLTHGNISSNVTAAVGLFDFAPTDECLSFLPLSHIFERMFGHYAMFHAGVIINYAESFDTVPADMAARRPTIVAPCPALREDLRTCARRCPDELRLAAADLRMGPTGRARLGRSRDREEARPARARRQARAGRPAGIREAAGPHRGPHPASSSPAARRSRAGDRPVLLRGGTADPRGIRTHRDLTGDRREHPDPSQARHRRPADARRGGQDRGGRRDPDARPARDAGVLQQAGGRRRRRSIRRDGSTPATSARSTRTAFSRITDRKKDLIVTAGGKNIAPQPIENLARRNKFVVECGDARRPPAFPIMLVVPNLGIAQGVGGAHSARGNDSGGSSPCRRCARSSNGKSGGRSATSRSSRCRRSCCCCQQRFQRGDGRAHAELKVRRRVVEERHREAIESLYAEPHAD